MGFLPTSLSSIWEESLSRQLSDGENHERISDDVGNGRNLGQHHARNGVESRLGHRRGAHGRRHVLRDVQGAPRRGQSARRRPPGRPTRYGRRLRSAR